MADQAEKRPTRGSFQQLRAMPVSRGSRGLIRMPAGDYSLIIKTTRLPEEEAENQKKAIIKELQKLNEPAVLDIKNIKIATLIIEIVQPKVAQPMMGATVIHGPSGAAMKALVADAAQDKSLAGGKLRGGLGKPLAVKGHALPCIENIHVQLKDKVVRSASDGLPLYYISTGAPVPSRLSAFFKRARAWCNQPYTVRVTKNCCLCMNFSLIISFFICFFILFIYIHHLFKHHRIAVVPCKILKDN